MDRSEGRARARRRAGRRAAAIANPRPMFVLFSSKLGCLGSILVSLLLTGGLLLLLGIL